MSINSRSISILLATLFLGFFFHTKSITFCMKQKPFVSANNARLSEQSKTAACNCEIQSLNLAA